MEPTNTAYIVTGANGYVGRWMCKELKARGYDTLGLSRPGKTLDDLNSLSIPCRTYAEFADCLSPGCVVVHCAGMVGNRGSWKDYLEINRDWSVSLYEQAALGKAACFVFVSSVAAIGYKPRSPQCTIDETTPPCLCDRERYGKSKWLAEQALLDSSRSEDTRLIIPRAGLIYGRRSMACRQTWLQRGIVVDANQRVPLVHIANLIDAVEMAVSTPDAEGVYDVVDEEQPTLRELNRKKIQHGLMRYRPWPIGRCGYRFLMFVRGIPRAPWRSRLTRGERLANYYFMTRRLQYSTAKLRAATGWRPGVTLDAGLAGCADTANVWE